MNRTTPEELAADRLAEDRQVRGQAVVRDGALVRVVSDDAVPPGVSFEAVPPDDVWFEGAVPAWETDEMPDPGPDWPPDVVPVFLWPEEILRQALRDAPGPRLARVVAEAIDLAGNLDPDPGADTGPCCSPACRTTRWAT